MKKGVDHTGITVVYACHDGAGKYLLSKRSPTCRDEHGRWDIGGGGVEFGDTVDKTMRKELAEEFATDVVRYEFLGYRDVLREQEGTPTHWLALDFRVEIDPNKVRNNEPHKFDEIGWFSLDTFPEPMHSQWPLFLTKYEDRL